MSNIVPQNETEAGSITLFQEASIFDVERFEQVNRVATVMARASLIPDHLKGASYEVTFGNCFMISNLAATWGLDPFAVAQASSLVFGKIVLEGKLVRAVIKKFLRFDLHYAWFGRLGDMDRRCFVSERPLEHEGSDGPIPFGEEEIEALMKRSDWRITKGTLAKWHTKSKSGGINDNWAKDEDKMFRERGAREWCREFSPGLMLGVYTPDEFDEVEHTSRSNVARDVTPKRNPLLDEEPRTTEALSSTTAKPTSSGRKDDESRASDLPAEETGGAGNAATQSVSTLPQDPSTNSGDATGEAPSTLVRATFEEFSGALARVKKSENLPKAKDEFFRGKGLKPNETETKLFQSIYKAHEDRISANLDVGKTMQEVAGWIAADVPEEKL